MPLSADGSRLAFGASGDDDKGSESGPAYVFDALDGRQLQELAVDQSGDYFGASVSLGADGSRLAVGAYDDDGFKGAAYIFNATDQAAAEAGGC